jgi:hypothetical protein
MADNLNFQNFSTVQSDNQLKPKTIASAATIAPSGLITFITGTVAVVTITPPMTGAHMLCLIWTDATPTAVTAAGNINQIVTPVQNEPVIAWYDSASATYYLGNTPV